MAFSNSNFLKSQQVKSLKKRNSYRKAHLLVEEEKNWIEPIVPASETISDRQTQNRKT